MISISDDPTVKVASPVWIDELKHALRVARTGQDIDAIERRLDAIQTELLAEWTKQE